MTNEAQDDRVGQVLGDRYRIAEQLGEGGMGVVYRGERLQLGRPVAIKFLHSPYARSSKFVTRFEREARAMSKLAHPHCVSVIDFGMHEAPYIVMDFVTGSTLRDVLDEGPISVSRALAITRQILLGLSHAHGQGIIHRDIKPANIMLGEATGLGDHVRIFDFGLAKLHDGELEGDPSTAAIVGTPAYMAPEQARAERIDARVDLYATGVVLFELLTGQKPFQGADAFQVLCMQRDEPPPRLQTLRADLSDELAAVVACALEKDVSRRFQTAAEFITALSTVPEASERPSAVDSGAQRDPMVFAKTEQLVSPSAEMSVKASVRDAARRRRSRRLGFGALSLAVLLGAGFWLVSPTPPSRGAALGAGGPNAVQGAQDEVAGAAELPQATASPPPAADELRANRGGETPAEQPEATDLDMVFDEAGEVADQPDAAAASASGDIDDDELSAAALAAADQALDETTEAEARIEKPTSRAQVVRSVAQVHALMRKKRYDEAIEGIRHLRKASPNKAELPFLLGEIYFERGWWSDSMAKYREAIRLHGGYRKRASLQRNAIKALGEGKTYPRARALLVKDVRRAALGRLRQAQKRDSSPLVRRRARTVIAQITR